MTTIYLIRHAEAEGNLYRRAQGHFNSNVTYLGGKQISALAERFRDVHVDALWASDLNRTRSTAAAIRKYHPELALNVTPRLREIDVGVWEDVPWGQLDHDEHEMHELFNHDPGRWRVEGGEPYADVQTRMRDIILELAAMYDGKAVAVVSHAYSIRALACLLYGIPSEEVDSLPYGDNTSVTTLEAENGVLRVVQYGDASHLEAAGLSTFARQHWRKPGTGKRIHTRFEPLDPRREGELYERCYADTWRASHGSLTGYAPAVYLHTAERLARRDPRCVMKLLYGEAFAGVVQLDPDRGREAGAGWISLLYIEPGLRGMRLGAQLIGHAVSVFRREGRGSIRLHVAEDNENALGFYEQCGFTSLRREQGIGGPLRLMEMSIAPHILTPEEI